MENKLKYRDEIDKSFGVTGMAISLVVFDGDDRLVSIALDNAPGEMIDMHSSFYFAGNPGLSAKAAWQQMKQNFGFSVAMLIGNVMSRRMIQDRTTVEPEVRDYLTKRAIEEGSESLGLESDEIREIFDKEYHYLHNIFSHVKLHDIVEDFAETLRRRRNMSRLEIIELLRTLNMI